MQKKIMGCFDNLHIVFLSTVLIIHFQGFRATATDNAIVAKLCLGGNYTANSKYHANLKLLLASLSSNSRPIEENLYYNDTIGQKPDAAYGSFQCRGDATFKVCQDCVTTVTQEILNSERCANSKQGIFWYLDCMFRYSDEYFFTIVDTTPPTFLWKEGNVSRPGQFNQILDIVMNDLATQAVSNASSPTWFATGEITYRNQKRYGLVQCCSDLSNNSCSKCLQAGFNEIRKCCDGKGSGIVLLPTCFFRYETVPFYGLEIGPLPSPAVLPHPQSTNTTVTNAKRKKPSKTVVIIVVILVIALFIVVSTTIWYSCLQRRMAMKNAYDDIQSAESWQFNFSTIRAATDNFSDSNKLGEGGFGSVYKGTLSDGQKIAVKRLSKCSGQGQQEFKNEVVLVAKLQHRNLVRLLGFCLYEEEKLLIYEFMLNASLDQFIFDPTKRTYIDWEKRYNIIIGIARGLLYLHEDSRLRIIHRDLKASNILLGEDMSPKISDFGMAKIFSMDQTQDSTKRIVGTYGYMAPEYAMHGQFSVKSDVFSFGVLVLEILSGRRNNSFCELEDVQDLLTYTWRHWQEEKILELLDPTLREHYTTSEVMRCVQIGLLCVQEDVAHRPTMASIVYNLNNQFVALPSPSAPPAFFVDSNQAAQELRSVNEASFTKLYPR